MSSKQCNECTFTVVMLLHLYNVSALVLWQWCAVKKSIIIGVPLGKAEPPGQIWKSLFVAFKHQGIVKNLT